MADFRKKLFGLASVATMFSGMAYGQYCNGGTVTLATVGGASFIRQEGQTELLPPMTFTCTTASVAGSVANLSVYLSPAVSITSKAVTASTVEASATPTGGATVQGTVIGSAVTFSNIILPAGTMVITIANIRVNASAIPVGAAGSLPSPISAQAFVSGTLVTPGPSNAPSVAFTFAGLGANSGKVYKDSTEASTSITNSFGVCGNINTGGAASATAGLISVGGTGLTVAINEGFQNAFKTVAEEVGNGPGAVAPNSGTRIKLVFNNVPSGLNIYMPQVWQGSQTAGGPVLTASLGVVGQITLVANETGPSGAGNATIAATTPSAFVGVTVTTTTLPITVPPTTATTAVPLVLLTVSGGTASAVYEITSDNPTANDYFAVPVYLQAATNTVVPGAAMTITTGLAPQPATAASIVPSFSSTAASIVTTSTIAFNACSTTLLFPFVTNVNGYETGIAISNTSKDTFGTKTQSGTCTLNFFASGVTGATNPTAVTAPNLAEGANQPYLAGETYAFTLTQALGINAANPATFQGYVIAACNFSLAHGFGYILGGLQPGNPINNTNTTMGYLALVLNRGAVSPINDFLGF